MVLNTASSSAVGSKGYVRPPELKTPPAPSTQLLKIPVSQMSLCPLLQGSPPRQVIRSWEGTSNRESRVSALLHQHRCQGQSQ